MSSSEDLRPACIFALDLLMGGVVCLEHGIVAKAGLEAVAWPSNTLRGRAMRLFTPLLAIALLALGLGACMPTPAGYGPNAKEDRLAAGLTEKNVP